MSLFARELRGLERELRAGDATTDCWRRLARVVERTGAEPDFLTRDADLKTLLDLARADEGEPMWPRLALGLLGLEPQPMPPEKLPRAWADEALRWHGDVPLDPASGLPLRARRRRDDAAMALVPPGSHSSRRPERDLIDDQPRIRAVERLYLDVEPVTAARYGRFLAATGGRVPLYWSGQVAVANRPVVFVDFDDASRYATWAGGRPPREAEWERAAGQGQTTFPWGDDEPTPETCNYQHDRRDARAWSEYLAAVDARPQAASAFGILDLLGNTTEWCLQDQAAFPADPALDEGELCAVRGASWRHALHQVGVASRFRLGRRTREGYLGFRVALSVAP